MREITSASDVYANSQSFCKVYKKKRNKENMKAKKEKEKERSSRLRQKLLCPGNGEDRSVSGCWNIDPGSETGAPGHTGDPLGIPTEGTNWFKS